ncbi:MAG TPA: hypothetical protein DCP40_08665 [Stenotrophomonas sp.]|nr:hypothetical protein [Stenotrophomonas sp.]
MCASAGSTTPTSTITSSFPLARMEVCESSSSVAISRSLYVPSDHAMNKSTSRLCPACQQEMLRASTRERHFNPRGNPVVVELLVMECPSCGATAASEAQHVENLRRLEARREHYRGLLLGEDILAFRRRHGLTQRAAATLFGKGAIAFSRYENETTYPDDAMTMLLWLAIEKPEVVRWLAERTGTVVPLLDPPREAAAKPARRVVRSRRGAPGPQGASIHAAR